MGQSASATIGYGLPLTEEIMAKIGEANEDFNEYEIEEMITDPIYKRYKEEHESFNLFGYTEHEDYPDRDAMEWSDFRKARDEFEEWWHENTDEGQAAKAYQLEVDTLGITVAHGGSYDYADRVIMAKETVTSGDWNDPRVVDPETLKTPDFEGRLRRAFALLSVEIDFDLDCNWYLLSSFD